MQRESEKIYFCFDYSTWKQATYPNIFGFEQDSVENNYQSLFESLLTFHKGFTCKNQAGQAWIM